MLHMKESRKKSKAMEEIGERGQKVKIKYYCFPHLKIKSKARKTLAGRNFHRWYVDGIECGDGFMGVYFSPDSLEKGCFHFVTKKSISSLIIFDSLLNFLIWSIVALQCCVSFHCTPK